jgi:hypothetical protein
MALTNAQKERRRLDKLRDKAFVGTPEEFADAIFFKLGPDRAREVGRALDKRLRNRHLVKMLKAIVSDDPF